VVIVDANVLIYAVDRASSHHEASYSWLEGALNGSETVGLAWTVLLAFIRLSTSPSVFPTPWSASRAMDQVELWLSAPAAVIAEPTLRHANVIRALLADAGTAGNLTTDAHLAALAIEHAAEIVSYDREFARFGGVRHRLPG
jgi:hypothetical protein